MGHLLKTAIKGIRGRRNMRQKGYRQNFNEGRSTVKKKAAILGVGEEKARHASFFNAFQEKRGTGFCCPLNGQIKRRDWTLSI